MRMMVGMIFRPTILLGHKSATVFSGHGSQKIHTFVAQTLGSIRCASYIVPGTRRSLDRPCAIFVATAMS